MGRTAIWIANLRTFVVDEAEKLPAENLANDLIGLAWEHEAERIVVPAGCLPDEVFDLRSGILGEMAQKASNYRVRMVIIGDVSGHVEASKAFRDYVYETNKGLTLWFVADMAALEARLVS
ncbi:DUF4180 domain-containing protein [Pelagibacterium nitratireducens]|jgi:hypothetical protein|uniref:DUF4180 domain-containing protein n=1 Tax=Pelagibacterium nitratireducens TaxID=1046114 RepID=A0ABZ2HUL4_9HYPH|tara:strand:+ start:4293 stop:4655 length:363 start_codon:yes stop_codon:yes gene_type:complete